MVVDGFLGLIELHRDLAFSVHMQREDIRSGVMPARVKLPARGARGPDIDLGDQEAVFFMHRPCDGATERLVDDGVARVDPLVLVREQFVAVRHVFGDVRGFQRRRTADDPAPALARDVLQFSQQISAPTRPTAVSTTFKPEPSPKPQTIRSGLVGISLRWLLASLPSASMIAQLLKSVLQLSDPSISW